MITYFRNSRLQMVVLGSLVHVTGNHVGHRFSDILQHSHAGNFLLDGTKSVNLCSELFALRGKFDGLFGARLHGTRQGSSHAESAIVQDIHSHLETATNLTQHVFNRNFDVVIVHLKQNDRLDSSPSPSM